MRAAIYARVSSAAQREAQTIENQLRVLPAYAKAQGWKVVATFIDDGRSAKSGNLAARAGLADLHAAAAARAFDVVLVLDMDRLTRSEDLIERAAVLGPFQRAGIKVATVASGILDLDTALGDFYAQFQAAAAADWVRKHRERIKAGKVRSIAAGRKPAGPTPYGWIYERATGAWSLHPTASKIVRELYERAAAGEGCSRLADDLNARDIARARGGRWSSARVWSILMNTGGRGVYVVDKARSLTIPIPRIVSDETWHAAVEAIRKRRSTRTPRGASTINLCQGLARCGVCGGRMWVSHNKKTRYYGCSGKVTGGKGTPRCPNRLRRVEDTDALVWAKLLAVLDDPAILDETLAERRARTKTASRDWAAEAEGYETRLVHLARAEAIVLERFQRGKISPAAFDKAIESGARDRAILERNRDLARQQLAGATRTARDTESLVKTLRAMAGRISRAAPSERRGIVRHMVTEIIMHPERVEIDGQIETTAPSVSVTSEAGYSSQRSKPVKFKVVA